jgi:hypothetical protein
VLTFVCLVAITIAPQFRRNSKGYVCYVAMTIINIFLMVETSEHFAFAGTFAVAGMFGGVAGRRMCEAEEHRGVGAADKASTPNVSGCSELEELPSMETLVSLEELRATDV